MQKVVCNTPNISKNPLGILPIGLMSGMRKSIHDPNIIQNIRSCMCEVKKNPNQLAIQDSIT